mmetsp:Transcript_6995/g.18306  ORF Transcript_6995/g.18306 Transcript_6995/m.18306 type:complete len:254 (+) Transcript_6995:415-1176(+)
MLIHALPPLQVHADSAEQAAPRHHRLGQLLECGGGVLVCFRRRQHVDDSAFEPGQTEGACVGGAPHKHHLLVVAIVGDKGVVVQQLLVQVACGESVRRGLRLALCASVAGQRGREVVVDSQYAVHLPARRHGLPDGHGARTRRARSAAPDLLARRCLGGREPPPRAHHPQPKLRAPRKQPPGPGTFAGRRLDYRRQGFADEGRHDGSERGIFVGIGRCLCSKLGCLDATCECLLPRAGHPPPAGDRRRQCFSQ